MSLKEAPSQDARHRKLFEKITFRGPKAYDLLLRILREHFPDAYEILTHVSYRTRYAIDDNDNAPSIRELLNRNGIGNQAAVNNVTSNNNNNNDIHYLAVPSTSRSISPRIQEISNQLMQASISHPRAHVIEFKEPINPEINVQVQFSTQFHEDSTSKVGVCKLSYPYSSSISIFLIRVILKKIF